MNILNRLKRLFCNDAKNFLVLPNFAVIRKSSVSKMRLAIYAGEYVVVVTTHFDDGLYDDIRCRLNVESEEEAEEILRQLTKELVE